MSQNMTLSNYSVPGDFRMSLLKSLGYSFGCLTDYFQVPFYSTSQHPFSQVVVKGLASYKALDSLSRIKHIPQKCSISFFIRHK